MEHFIQTQNLRLLLVHNAIQYRKSMLKEWNMCSIILVILWSNNILILEDTLYVISADTPILGAH
jgi:hypothetical protein